MANTANCLYCMQPIPYEKRSDALYCSESCRDTAEKRRHRNVVSAPRGKNTGRSSHPDYKKELRKNKPKPVYKGKYAKARALGFRSMFEVKVAENAIENNVEFVYEPHSLSYTYEATYTPDFLLPNGVLVECKGRLSEKDRRKMLAVKKCNPELDIRFIFQKANTKLTKAKKGQSYGDWADKHGFPWAEGSIPLSWWKRKEEEIGG